MASIRKKKLKDGSISFQVQVRLRGHQPVSAAFQRLTDAKRWIAETETAIRDGRYFQIEAKRHTVAELVERFIEHEIPRRPKMRLEYVGQLRWWKNHIGEKLLSELTPALIVEYRDQLSKSVTYRGTKMSNARVNRYLAALSSALTTAVNEWQWLSENPAKKVRRLKEPRGRVRYLDDDERARLLNACKESHNRDLYLVVVLSLSTGARRAEIWSISWKNIDLKKSMAIFEDTKNDDRRSVPLTGHVLELLCERNRVRRLDTPLVFPSTTDPLRPFDFRRPFTMALKAAEIEDFRWHDLRHCCASYLVQNGVSLPVVAEILGHRDTSITQRYAHLSPEHLRESVVGLDKKMFG